MTLDLAQLQAADDRARSTALAIAAYAGWHITTVGPMLSPAFAGCLYVDAAQLLLVPSNAALSSAYQLADQAAREARSDALVVSSDHSRDCKLAFGLGLWSSRSVRWLLPVVPWLGRDGLLWMVAPGLGSQAAAPGGTAFPLRRGRLVDQPEPWATPAERAAGERRPWDWLAMRTARPQERGA